MAKSFIPEYVRKLNKLSVYVSKHQSKMSTYTLTTAQAATFAQIQAAAAAWAGVQTEEQP